MNRLASASLCLFAAVSSLTTHAATPSVNGANVFAEPSIIDVQDNQWTIVGGVIQKNGVRAGSNHDVDLLLELNGSFYQRNTSNDWFRWNGSEWPATTDPRVVSASGTKIGVGTNVLIDSARHVWTLASDAVAYIDGARAAVNYNIIAVLYYKGVIYTENTGDAWYEWTGSAWKRISGDPMTSDALSMSANGAFIGVGTGSLVDSGDNVWTLQTNEIAYRNGTRADGNYNTILLLFFNEVIYCENTSGDWYAWSGSAWTRVAADPRGPNVVQFASYSSPVCPASDPTCVPAFVDDSSVTFTQTTTKGDTIWVAATVSDYGGTHAITVTDSQHNTYQQLNQDNDKAPGSQSLAQFYATNIAGGADTVTVNWTSDNYKGVLAAEIAGVSRTSLLGHSANIQDGKLSAGNNNVTSADITVESAQTPSILIALTMDTDGGGSDTGGSGFCAIPAGSGFTQVTQTWSWSATGQPACNLATLETKVIRAAGSAAGTFTSTHVSDPYVTVATAFH